MIVHVITATTNPGKIPQMMAWSQKAAAFVEEDHGQEVSVLVNFGGPGNEVHFMTTHDSLAALEAYIQSINEDERYHELLREAHEQELWGETRTSVYRSAF